MKFFPVFTLITALTVAGCSQYVVNAPHKVNSPKGEKAAVVPPPLSDPEDQKTEKKPAPVSQAATVKVKETVKPITPPAVKKVDPPAVKPAAANTAPSKPAVPAKVPSSPEKFRRGPGMWRVFTRLPLEEQQKLLKLQRTAPERYREIMQKKVDELYQQEKARRKALDELAVRYDQCADPAEKNKIKALLREKILEDFKQRLQDTRRDIESYKRRTAHLEAELQKREKNCDAIVNLMLDKQLTSKSGSKAKK